MVSAIQPNAADQARIAALNMAGKAAEHAGVLAINVLDTLGADLEFLLDSGRALMVAMGLNYLSQNITGISVCSLRMMCWSVRLRLV